MEVGSPPYDSASVPAVLTFAKFQMTWQLELGSQVAGSVCGNLG